MSLVNACRKLHRLCEYNLTVVKICIDNNSLMDGTQQTPSQWWTEEISYNRHLATVTLLIKFTAWHLLLSANNFDQLEKVNRKFSYNKQKNICFRFQVARYSQHLVIEHSVMWHRSSGTICLVKYPALTLFQILNVMLKNIFLNKLLICSNLFHLFY